MSRKRRPIKTKNPRKRTALEKGNALEQAVGAIETAILGVEPAAKGKPLTVQYKKIIEVDGVRHEIDLYVIVDLGSGYTSIFIFECKNWAKPVSKNDIIIFSEKIKTIGAAHGYFVAPSFTEDARAQAKKDNRMTLRIVTEHDPLQLSEFQSFGVHIRYNLFQLEFHTRDGEPLPAPIGSLQEMVQYQGSTVDLEKLTITWCREVAKEKLRVFGQDKKTGTYDYDLGFVRRFSPGELETQCRDISEIRVVAKTTVEVYQRPIASSFEIESRGRIISYEDVEWAGFREKDSRLVVLYEDETKK